MRFREHDNLHTKLILAWVGTWGVGTLGRRARCVEAASSGPRLHGTTMPAVGGVIVAGVLLMPW